MNAPHSLLQSSRIPYDLVSGGGEKNVLFEHLQARPTIELALDRLEAVDLPFNDP
jgi:hypothetical protein